jgi:hypothetical protein
MRSRLERLHGLERLLLDEAKAAHARAALDERASRRGARQALDDAARIETGVDTVVGAEGPVEPGALGDRALLCALLDRTAALARRRISAYAATRTAASAALARVAACDRRRKGIETIASHHAAALLRQLDNHEEGVADDRQDRRE